MSDSMPIVYASDMCAFEKITADSDFLAPNEESTVAQRLPLFSHQSFRIINLDKLN